MVAGNTEERAFGTARGRFFEGLPSKAAELRTAMALLSRAPAAEAPREDLLHRLHALYASALAFRNDVLAQAVHRGIDRLDAARAGQRAVHAEDLEVLDALVTRLSESRIDERPSLSPAPPLLAEASDDFDPSPDAEGAAEVALAREPSEAAVAGASRDQPLLQRVLHVLLLAARGEQTDVIELLRSDSVRVSSVASVEELIESIHEDAPDLVLANERLASEGRLVELLRNDVASDFIPVVLFESAEPVDDTSEADVDARVARPFTGEQLVRAIGRATGTLVAPQQPAELGELTVEQLAERIAKEVYRGLVDGAARGRAQRVAMAKGSEILSATYGALSELRASIVRESGGRVQFHARAADGGPSLVSLAPTAVQIESADGLSCRRVVLVEDDSAIVLLLANLLRAQGATVHELTDGRETLEAARRERPDLVITGGRVPNLDAFALCRELAADPLLADVPVLLLPPKEQLLARAREPGAGVKLRRELAAQVVASATRLLAPRRVIEERLRAEGEVRGTLEGTGVIALLRSVRRTRPNARVRIRDAWNLFECELREGRLAQLTRTASDGSFVRNERALPQLLGATAGRFVVVSADGPMKVSFEGTLDEVLTRGARELAGELDAVSGTRLARIARVVFDEDAYAALVQQTPRVVRTAIGRLYAGEPPVKLIKAGVVSAQGLEPILLDMARRGALRGVVGAGGEDLVAEARAERAREQATSLSSPQSVAPPPLAPVISLLPEASSPAAAAAEAAGLRAAPPVAAAATEVVQPPARVSQPAASPGAAPARSDAAHARPRASLAPAANGDAQAAAAARGRESSLAEASEHLAAAAEARHSRSTLAAWTVALFGLAAISILVTGESEQGARPVEALGAREPEAVAPVSTLTPRGEGSSLGSAEDNGFIVYDKILDESVGVPKDHALMVIEATPSLAGTTVWLNDRELGPPPQKFSLPEGVHELAIKRGNAMSYRFVSVHPGRTWVLQDP